MFITCLHHATIKFIKKIQAQFFLFNCIPIHIFTLGVSSNRSPKIVIDHVIIDLILKKFELKNNFKREEVV
jgi:hypothetical protein